MTDLDLCNELVAKLPNLADKDQDFAASLVKSVRKYSSATSKQRFWLEALVKRADGEAPAPRAKSEVGDLQGIAKLFATASRNRLKAPAIVIGIAGIEIRLNVAGAKARSPGSINVATNASFRESVWYGRILKDGQFEHSPRAQTPEGLVEGLQRFAAEPAKVAAEYGKLSGRCCFCDRGLTDERSTFAGFGPVCAKNFGLAFPNVRDARSGTLEMFQASAA